MRFVVTGEWNRNRLLQVIALLYAVYVALLVATNILMYFGKMSLAPASVVAHYLGSESDFSAPLSYQGMLELSHFHLFAVGMLLMVLTHLMLFIPVSGKIKAWLIAVPFLAGFVSEISGWLVRFVSPNFAIMKVAGFLLLQASLITLVIIAVWAVFTKHQAGNYTGFVDED